MTTTPPGPDEHPADQPTPGYRPPPRTYYEPIHPATVPLAPGNGIATSAGVCGIVAAAISWIPVIDVASLVLALIAVALGGVGLVRANRYGRQGWGTPGKGMAITGIVLGVAGVAVSLAVISAASSALSGSLR